MKYEKEVMAVNLYNVHDPEKCAEQACCIHNPSDHVMKDFPQLWRNDRYMMERVCPHGIGHPDPDHMTHMRLVYGNEFASYHSIHGCDGCCSGSYIGDMKTVET